MTLVFEHSPRLTWGRLARCWAHIDRVTLVCVAFLMCLGLVLGFATSPALALRNDLPPFHYVTRQAIFAVPALAAMLLLSMASPRTIRRLGVLLFLAAIGLLVLTLLIGETRNGATRWLSLGLFSLQPSELAKPALIAASAWMFSIPRDPDAPPGALVAFGCLALVAALVALQPDYSQTALLCVVWAVMFFVAGASIIWAASGLMLALGGGAIAYAVSPYVADRIELLFDLEAQGGYQIRKTLAAIREGGLWGAGAGEGVEKFTLPDAHTDFVIAVAAEEYGLALIALVLLAYALIVVRGLMAAARLKDGFSRVAVAGLCALIGLQAFIHVGVSARMLPPTGMTLPLVSYGGSSLLSMSIVVGMLLGLTRSDRERIR